MEKSISPSNMTHNVYFDDIKSCPICNSKISPIYLYGKSLFGNTKFSLFCECPSCGKTFTAFYDDLVKNTHNNNFKYIASNLSYLAPIFPAIKTFDDKIQTLSPNFVEIYNQSLSAEAYNLSQIAGMGYRKALEFLIKDYCILKNPHNADTIVGMPLGNCINIYIDDAKIKSLAKLSVWLGNDETHYVRKFQDKDINDLKCYIDTALYFIILMLMKQIKLLISNSIMFCQ